MSISTPAGSSTGAPGGPGRRLTASYRAAREAAEARRAAARSATAHAAGRSQPVGAPARTSGDGDLVPPAVRASALWTACLLVVAAGVYLLLRLLSEFMVLVVPVLIALLLAALVRPFADLGVRRLRLPRALASIMTILALLGVVGGLVGLVGERTAEGLPALREQAGAGVERLQQILREGPLNLSTAQLDGYIDQARESLGGNTGQLVSGAVGVASTAADVGGGFFIMLFSLFFFLSSGDRIWAFLVRLFPRTARPRVTGAGVRAWSTLTSFVRATVIVALVDAVGIGLGAWILDVPLALPIAVLVFLGAFVPIVGALVTGAIAVLVALVTQDVGTALLMLGVVLLVQQLEAHVLQPFLLGRAVEVHPLAVILAVGAGVLLAGIVGALFAVPLVAVGHVVAEYLSSDEPEPDPDSHPLDPGTRTPQEDADVAAEQSGPLADAPTAAAERSLQGTPGSGRG